MTDDNEKREPNPLEDLLRQLGIDPRQLPPGFLAGGGDLGPMIAQFQGQFGQMASQFSAMFAAPTSGNGINWESTKDHARRFVAAKGADPTPTPEQRREVREAVDLAEQWLSQATDFAPLSGEGVAWSRAEWVEKTMPTWSRLVEPVVNHLGIALQNLAAEQVDEGSRAEVQRHLQPMIRQAAASMFTGHLAQSIGELAVGSLSATEVVLPVLAEPTVVLLPASVEAFAAEVEQPARDVRIYLALREAARQRLFAAAPWLSLQLLAQVEHYAREIRIDASSLEEAMGNLTEVDPEALAKLSASLFSPAETDEQKEILGRIGTLLALVEGWVDHVAAQAGGPWLPNLSALEEANRRRRATNGPSASALSTILGMTLEPKRIRAAANLWGALLAKRGAQGRDDVWNHPDLLPSAAELDDPIGYAAGETRDRPDDDLDRELNELLRSEGKATEDD